MRHGIGSSSGEYRSHMADFKRVEERLIKVGARDVLSPFVKMSAGC
jgi:hypothetical protein